MKTVNLLILCMFASKSLASIFDQKHYSVNEREGVLILNDQNFGDVVSKKGSKTLVLGYSLQSKMSLRYVEQLPNFAKQYK